MKKISAPTRKRLVILSRILSQLGKKRVTSIELSSITGWSEATIRRDISALELHSGLSNGYDPMALHDAICSAFNIAAAGERKRCCIVGLGKLGSALLESAFEGSGFELVAGFDSNVNKIEIMDSPVPLFATLDLERKIRSLKIEYAVLSVPDEKAQLMADRLASYGIKGIVNYTNIMLSLPKGVRVENVNTVIVLTNMLSE